MRSPSVKLAVWLHARGFGRLSRLMPVYWRARNVFLDWYEPRAFKVWKFFAPKCEQHPGVPLVQKICGRCAIERTVQRVRLDQLAGRR